MRDESQIAAAAALIGNPGRAAMLAALIDGRALPANELAAAAGLSAAGASGHLAQLVAGGFLTVIHEGRHRYYRLANEHIATILEGLAAMGEAQASARPPAKPGHVNPLRFARTCYSHLAGELGVAVATAMLDQGLLSAGEGKRFTVTAAGAHWFSVKLGIEAAALKPGRHGIACGCLDWTERRYHLAGPLGASLLQRCLDRSLLHRDKRPRTVTLTSAGADFVNRELGLKCRPLIGPAQGSAGGWRIDP